MGLYNGFSDKGEPQVSPHKTRVLAGLFLGLSWLLCAGASADDPPSLGIAAPEEPATSLSTTVAEEPLRLTYNTPVTLGTLKVELSGPPNSQFDFYVNGAFLQKGEIDESGTRSFKLPVYTPGEMLCIYAQMKHESWDNWQDLEECVVVQPYPIDVKPVVTEGYLKARATADMLNEAGTQRCPKGWKPDGSGSRCTKDFTMSNGGYRIFVTPWFSQYFDTQNIEAYALTVRNKKGRWDSGTILELESDVALPGLIEYDRPLSACLTGLSAHPRLYPAFPEDQESQEDKKPSELLQQPDNLDQMDYSLCVPIGSSGKESLRPESTRDVIKLFYYTVRPSDGLVQLQSSGEAAPLVTPATEFSQRIPVLFPVLIPLTFYQPEG